MAHRYRARPLTWSPAWSTGFFMGVFLGKILQSPNLVMVKLGKDTKNASCRCDMTEKMLKASLKHYVINQHFVPKCFQEPSECLVKHMMIAWYTVLNSISDFQLYRCGHWTYPFLPGILFTTTPHNILLSHWLLSHITFAETMDSSEKGINPMTIINPQKEYCPMLGIAPATSCSQVLYATD